MMLSAVPTISFVSTMTSAEPSAEQIIAVGQSRSITDGVLYVNELFSWLTNDYYPLIIVPAVIKAISERNEIYEP